MHNRWLHTFGGLVLGAIAPILAAGLIAAVQGVTFNSFIWTLFNFNSYYNSFFQLGIAINIGVFFLLMKSEKTIYFSRGWLVATILLVLWTVLIDIY